MASLTERVAAGVLIQTDIEGEILRLSDLLENATDQLGEALEKSAKSDADWHYFQARAFYSYDGPEWRARADVLSSDEGGLYRAYKVDAAAAEHLKEKCRQLRAQLDAVRTLSANVRIQT